jgi:ribosomal protein L29
MAKRIEKMRDQDTPELNERQKELARVKTLQRERELRKANG